jgi:hypothetical protein
MSRTRVAIHLLSRLEALNALYLNHETTGGPPALLAEPAGQVY